MGQDLSPARARPKAHVFWKARSPTFGEGPRPGQARSPTFGEGPENPSFFTTVYSKIRRPVKARTPAFMKRLSPGQAGPDSSKPGLSPGPTFQDPTHH